MSRIITADFLTRENFAEFGEVIETEGAENYPINNGMCTRYHALAKAEAAGPNAHVLINIVRAKPHFFPLELKLVERHPFGSQAFVPLNGKRYLVVVCHEGENGPGDPHAFVAEGHQGVNYPRNLWHAVLTQINEAQDFLVVDRGGDGTNLEEFTLDEPWEIHLPGMTL
jgi:ureidoglycolate lyase